MTTLAGTVARSTGTYRDPTGLLDPPDPSVDIIDPAGATVAAAVVPVRDSLGTYHVDYLIPLAGPAGIWVFRWAGTINGTLEQGDDLVAVTFTVVAAFDATIEGVNAYVPALTIGDTTKPSRSNVETYLDLTSGQVSAAVARSLAALTALAAAGTIDAADVDRWRQMAASLAELGAAAMAQDAAYPELAAASETDQRYGASLWNRYRQGLADLPKDLAAYLAQYDESPAGDPGTPAVSGPLPLFRRDMAW